MDGGGERESTKHEAEAEAEAEYHCHDFDWEDLRADVEANPCLSHHLSPFPTTTPSPPPPSSEAWRSFHRRHASGKFFKVSPHPPLYISPLCGSTVLFAQILLTFLLINSVRTGTR
jgi:methyltransferase-like protein 6